MRIQRPTSASPEGLELLYVKGTSIRFVHLPEEAEAEGLFRNRVRQPHLYPTRLCSARRNRRSVSRVLPQLKQVDQGAQAFRKRIKKPLPPPPPKEKHAPLVSASVTEADAPD